MDNPVVKFLEDYKIPYRMRKDWANVCCPYCADAGFHLGLSSNGAATCFRCGTHNLNAVIHELIHCTSQDARRLARVYFRSSAFEKHNDVNLSAFEIPSSGSILKNRTAYRYLRERFIWMNVEEFKSMIDTYKITYTSSAFSDYMLAGRIVFPLIHNGIPVSYQARDYTGNSKAKYMTASKVNERIFHKDLLYGEDYVPYSTIIVCEGVFDALSIGKGAVHTFGVKFSKAQVEALYAYDTVYIAYDMDSAGCLGASALARELKHRVKVKRIKLSCHDVNSCSVNEIEDIRGLLL